MNSLRQAFIPLVALGLLAGCNTSKTSTSSTSSAGTVATNPAEPSPDTVVATYDDGQKVTYGQLEAQIKGPLGRLEQEKAMLRQKGLEGMVTKALVDTAAKKAGMTEKDYLDAQLSKKVTTPSDLDVKRFYARNKQRLPSTATYDSLKPQIIKVLEAQQKRKVAMTYFADLRKQAHVKFMLPKSLQPKSQPMPFRVSPHAMGAPHTGMRPHAMTAHPAPATPAKQAAAPAKAATSAKK